MLERVIEYPGYLIKIAARKGTSDGTSDGTSGNPSSRQAIVFFHGFPANRHVKNLDLALLVSERVDTDIFLLHYRGLGESAGEFLFTKAIDEGIELIRWLTAERGYDKVILVGHSWGGTVAVNVTTRFPEKVEKLILISPLCSLTRQEPLFEYCASGVRQDCAGIFGALSPEAVRRDLSAVVDHHLPITLAKQLSSEIPVHIIQSRTDDVTPAVRTKEFVSQLSSKAIYAELEQDHSFQQNRAELAEAVAQEIKVAK